MHNKIKVLIVDDSALIRQVLREILSSDSEIEVVGTAPDPIKARDIMKKTNPDVITLDVEMPKMNGIDFLNKIMTRRPTPVIMISSVTKEGAKTTLEALELGAVDFILKPRIDLKKAMIEMANVIIEKVKMAAQAHVYSRLDADIIHSGQTLGSKNIQLIAIGASTGGVEAIRYLLRSLPDGLPPILVVQHMPKEFTGPFAQRLNESSSMTVKEASDDEFLKAGHVYIAPGDQHLAVGIKQGELISKLKCDKAVNGHIPSVDVLFSSVAPLGPKAAGVILSGMGKDGARGLLEMRQYGAPTIGQSEKSCVIYGMPKVAFQMGAVAFERSLRDLPTELISLIEDDHG